MAAPFGQTESSVLEARKSVVEHHQPEVLFWYAVHSMEMHQIRYFLAVAETLNFTRAADDCHVAQPSLSRAVQKLEEELGGDLFRRERNRTHLTELGRQMLPVLRQVYESAETAKALASTLQRSDRAPLRVGLSHTIHLDVITPMLAELEKAFPGLEIHFARGTASDVFGLLETGEIELGIAAGSEAEWDRLDHWPLFEEDFVLLVPPHGVEEGSISSALEAESVIVRPYCETLASRDVASNGKPARRHVAADDEDAAKLVRSGLGVAVIPSSSAQLSGGSSVAIEDIDLTRTVRVYGVAGRQRSPVTRAMINLLRAADWSARLPS